MVPLLAGELIVAERVRAGEQPECRGLDAHVPIAGLAADRAIAFARARAQVDIRLVADSPAVAAPMKRLQHGSILQLPNLQRTTRPPGSAGKAITEGCCHPAVSMPLLASHHATWR